MQLNPYNFRQYLGHAPGQPHASAWIIFVLMFALLAWWSFPYLAPEAVALRLPKTSGTSLSSPPAAFIIFNGNSFIYQNASYTLDELVERLQGVALLVKPQRADGGDYEKNDTQNLVILATSGNTSVQALLPLLERLKGLGFSEVAFTVKP